MERLTGAFSRISIVNIVVFSTLALSGCGGSSGDSTASEIALSLFDGTPVTPVVIGPEGGAVASDDGNARLVIPAGALTEMTEITFRTSTPPDGVTIESSSPLFIYEALPNGLTFATPAVMEIDAKSIATVSDTEFAIPLVTSATTPDLPAEVLSGQNLSFDFNTGSAVHTASVEHFSIFTVGRSEYSAVIDGVPDFHPENTAFGPVAVTLKAIRPNTSSFGPGLSGNSFVTGITYFDRSSAPVSITRDEPFDFFSDAVRTFDSMGSQISLSFSQSVPYTCGPANMGEFFAGLDVLGSTSLTTSRTVTEYTFGLSPLYGVIAEEEVVTSNTTITPFDFGFTGKRTVDCRNAGIVIVDDEEEPEVSIGDDAPVDDVTEEEPAEEEPAETEEVALFSGTYISSNGGCQIDSTSVSASGATVSFTPLGAENPGTSTCTIGADPNQCTSDSNSLTFFGVSDHGCNAVAVNGGAELTVSCAGSQGSCSSTLIRQ